MSRAENESNQTNIHFVHVEWPDLVMSGFYLAVRYKLWIVKIAIKSRITRFHASHSTTSDLHDK